MISHILIRDFAIIEEIDVGMSGGLSVVTGETGAGKSIIIEAVSMALGARADTAMVRRGREKTLIQIMVDESGLPEERRTGIELLSREISKEGKSVCRVNGEMTTLAHTKNMTGRVADIHGQYDHQSLLDPRNHMGVIDEFRADLIAGAKERVAEKWREYSSVKRALDSLLSEESQSKRELDFLRFEVNEIDAARPLPGERERLKYDLKVMQNSERIYEALSAAYGSISGNASSASESVSRAVGDLRAVSDISDEYRAMEESASEALYMIDELADTLRARLDSLDFSEQAINDTIARVDVLDRLVSKYGGGGGSIESVLEYRDKAEERLANIENLGEKKARLSRELSDAEAALTSASLELSGLRRDAAKELETKVTKQLEELNFPDAVFSVAFLSDSFDSSDSSDRDGDGRKTKISPADFSEDGIDEVEFMLSANRGQPSLPVAKFASGGEMSRVMLALKSVIGEFDGIPTMIFDEIDSGVSGVTASIVGEKLKRMAKDGQIICITHLPQIAAFADHHYMIEKRSDDADTYTTLTELSDEERVKEIARLIGGSTVTGTTMDSARELIDASK